MKINRYPAGRTNIAELEAGAQAIISPGRMAALKAGGYYQMADAAQSVTRNLLTVDQMQRQREEQLRQEEDRQVQQLMDIQQKAYLAGVSKNPKYKDQMQADGQPTASVMLKDYEEHAASMQAMLEQIQDPQTRKLEEARLKANIDLGRMAIRSDVNDRRERWATKTDYQLLDVMIQGEDFPAARQQLEDMYQKDRVSEAEVRVLSHQIEAGYMETEARNALSGYEQQIAVGNGEEVLAKVLADPHKDPAIQNMIVTGVKAQMANYDVAKRKQEDALTGAWMREVSDLLDSVANGQTINTDSLYNTMIGTNLDPTKAATLANQIDAAQRSRTVKEDGYALFTADQDRGVPHENSKANREYVDRYVVAQLESADPKARPVDIEIAAYKDTGLVGQKRQIQLESASTVEGLAQGAEFWSELHSDPYYQIEDGLSGERRGIYEMITRRAKDGGMSWGDAAKDVMDITKLDEVRKDVRKQLWVDDDGADKAEDYYDDLMDSNTYDKRWGWGLSGVDNVNDAENLIRYQMYLQDGLTLTGNWEDARSHADQVFKKSHVLTDINGTLEMQVGGIPSQQANGGVVNLAPLRDQFVQEILKGKSVMYTDSDGLAQIGEVTSSNGMTFDEPQQELGNVVYKVSINGNRVIDVETGNQLEAVIGPEDIYRLQVTQNQEWSEQSFAKGQADLQKDINDMAARIKSGEQFGKDMSKEKRIMEGKEQVMIERERQRREERKKDVHF